MAVPGMVGGGCPGTPTLVRYNVVQVQVQSPGEAGDAVRSGPLWTSRDGTVRPPLAITDNMTQLTWAAALLDRLGVLKVHFAIERHNFVFLQSARLQGPMIRERYVIHTPLILAHPYFYTLHSRYALPQLAYPGWCVGSHPLLESYVITKAIYRLQASPTFDTLRHEIQLASDMVLARKCHRLPSSLIRQPLPVPVT